MFIWVLIAGFIYAASRDDPELSESRKKKSFLQIITICSDNNLRLRLKYQVYLFKVQIPISDENHITSYNT